MVYTVDGFNVAEDIPRPKLTMIQGRYGASRDIVPQLIRHREYMQLRLSAAEKDMWELC